MRHNTKGIKENEINSTSTGGVEEETRK